MNLFPIYFAVIALAVGLYLSRAEWAKMLALVPLGALVPAFFGTGTGCGADFALHLFDSGHCTIGEDTPFRYFSAYFILGVIAVLVASVVVKIARTVIGRARGAE